MPIIPSPNSHLWDKYISDLIQRDGIICYSWNNQVPIIIPWHRHVGVEILYCEKGDGLFTLGQHMIPYSAGSLVLFDPQIPHQVNMRNAYVRWNVCFLPDAIGLKAHLYSQLAESLGIYDNTDYICLTQVDNVEKQRLHSLFSDLEREISEKRKGFEQITAIRLSELFLLFQRFLAEDIALAGTTNISCKEPRLHEILAYIENNLFTELPVQSIARHFHFSISHLYRLIHATTGKSPSQYIIARRIARARHMLEGSTLPVTEIASAVGITSTSHFCSRFKESTGFTPREYRLRHSPATAEGPARERFNAGS